MSECDNTFITLKEIESEIQDLRLAEKMLYRTKYNQKQGSNALEHIQSCIGAMAWLEECCVIYTKKRKEKHDKPTKENR